MTSPTVTVLGTGVMGAGMVRSLRRAGLPVRMWNRDPAKAQALTDTGAEAFEDPAEAAAGADVLLTMVLDADAVLDVVRRARPGPRQPLGAVLDGGPRGRPADGGARRRARPRARRRARARDQAAGRGGEARRPRLRPGGRRATGWHRCSTRSAARRCGSARRGNGSRLKLACNAWVFMVTAGVAQSIALTRALGLDPQNFLDAVDGGPLDLPYLHLKAANMIKGEHPVAFGLTGAAKDARLIREALQQAGVDDRLDAAVLAAMDAAAERLDDPGAHDLSAVIEGLDQRRRS